MEDRSQPRELGRVGESGRELGRGGEDESTDVVVRVGRDEDVLQEVNDVLLDDGVARGRRALLILSAARDRPSLEQDVAKLSDGPDSSERERLLRDVGSEGSVELEDGVRLELGGVGDEADES
jgi:hypothetical protein